MPEKSLRKEIKTTRKHLIKQANDSAREASRARAEESRIDQERNREIAQGVVSRLGELARTEGKGMSVYLARKARVIDWFLRPDSIFWMNVHKNDRTHRGLPTSMVLGEQAERSVKIDLVRKSDTSYPGSVIVTEAGDVLDDVVHFYPGREPNDSETSPWPVSLDEATAQSFQNLGIKFVALKRNPLESYDKLFTIADSVEQTLNPTPTTPAETREASVTE